MTNASVPSGPDPVFIFGCQRSGTSLLQEVLGLSPSVSMFHEADPRVMADQRMLARDTVLAAVRAAWPRRSVLKPLCDSHHADRILAEHPGSRAIWIYRHYADAANSLQRVWPGAQRGVISALRYRRFAEAAWLGERVSPEVLEHLELLWDEDKSNFESGCLLWCLRNHLYFELGLDRMTDRVLLLKYRDMVEAAEEVMPKVFDFVGAQFDPEYVAGILTWNIGKDPRPPMDPRIEALCDGMMGRLDAARPPLRTVRERRLSS